METHCILFIRVHFGINGGSGIIRVHLGIIGFILVYFGFILGRYHMGSVSYFGTIAANTYIRSSMGFNGG